MIDELVLIYTIITSTVVITDNLNTVSVYIMLYFTTFYFKKKQNRYFLIKKQFIKQNLNIFHIYYLWKEFILLVSVESV